MIQTIKMEHSFDSEGWNFKGCVQDLSDQQTRYKAF